MKKRLLSFLMSVLIAIIMHIASANERKEEDQRKPIYTLLYELSQKRGPELEKAFARLRQNRQWQIDISESSFQNRILKDTYKKDHIPGLALAYWATKRHDLRKDSIMPPILILNEKVLLKALIKQAHSPDTVRRKLVYVALRPVIALPEVDALFKRGAKDPNHTLSKFCKRALLVEQKRIAPHFLVRTPALKAFTRKLEEKNKKAEKELKKLKKRAAAQAWELLKQSKQEASYLKKVLDSIPTRGHPTSKKVQKNQAKAKKRIESPTAKR